MKLRHILFSLCCLGFTAMLSDARAENTAKEPSAEEADSAFSPQLRQRAKDKLASMGIEEADYDEKLQSVIGKDSMKSRRLAKLLIMAGADVEENGGDYLKKAAAHADVVKLLKKAGAKNAPQHSVVGKALMDAEYMTTARPAPNAKIYMYLYSASWCGPCRAVMPKIVEAYSEMKKNGVEVVLMGWENPDGIKNYVAHYNAEFPAIDGKSEQARRLPGYQSPNGIPLLRLYQARAMCCRPGMAPLP